MSTTLDFIILTNRGSKASLESPSGLGAGASDLRRSVVLRHLWPLALGLAAGVPGALALARDAATLASVAALLTVICLAAMLAPTRRFGRIEPMRVLRVE